MAIDPSTLYHPYNPFSPGGSLFSPFASYFLPPAGQGLSLAPYSGNAWYAFHPAASAGLGLGASMDPLFALFRSLYPSLSGFAGGPATPPQIPTPMGPARDAPLSTGLLPPVPTTFTPTGGGGAGAGITTPTAAAPIAPAAAGMAGGGLNEVLGRLGLGAPAAAGLDLTGRGVVNPGITERGAFATGVTSGGRDETLGGLGGGGGVAERGGRLGDVGIGATSEGGGFGERGREAGETQI